MKLRFIIALLVLFVGFIGIGYTQSTEYGTDALTAETTGTDNAAFGLRTLSSLTTGQGNTALGAYAGRSSLTVNGGIYLGYGAGWDNTTAHKLFIGTRFYPDYYITGTLSSGLFGINMTPTRAWDVTGSIAASDTVKGAYVQATTTFLGGFTGDFVVTGDTLIVSAEALVSYDGEADTSTVRVTATPNIALFGADGDNYTIGINTSDAATFTGAGGGYSFDGAVSGTSGTFSGNLTGYRPVHYNMDADSTLTTALIPPGSLIAAIAVAAKRTYTLPAAAVGLEYPISVTDSDSLRFTTATNDSVLVAGTAYKIISSVNLDGVLTAIDGTYWLLHNEIGTATGY